MKYCSSNYAIQHENKYICTNAPVSVTTYKDARQLNEKCFYKEFNNPFNMEDIFISSEKSFCGFNLNPGAYCNQRKGDALYLKYIAEFKAAYQQGVVCHTSSDNHKAIDVDCAALLKKMPGFNLLHRQATFIIRNGGNAQVAANPVCVKDTLTKYFWEGKISQAALVGGGLFSILVGLLY